MLSGSDQEKTTQEEQPNPEAGGSRNVKRLKIEFEYHANGPGKHGFTAAMYDQMGEDMGPVPLTLVTDALAHMFMGMMVTANTQSEAQAAEIARLKAERDIRSG